MLYITITPSALYFNHLSDDLHTAISQLYKLEECKKGHCIKGEPAELYKVLVKLSYTYDIELS